MNNFLIEESMTSSETGVTGTGRSEQTPAMVKGHRTTVGSRVGGASNTGDPPHGYSHSNRSLHRLHVLASCQVFKLPSSGWQVAREQRSLGKKQILPTQAR